MRCFSLDCNSDNNGLKKRKSNSNNSSNNNNPKKYMYTHVMIIKIKNKQINK